MRQVHLAPGGIGKLRAGRSVAVTGLGEEKGTGAVTEVLGRVVRVAEGEAPAAVDVDALAARRRCRLRAPLAGSLGHSGGSGHAGGACQHERQQNTVKWLAHALSSPVFLFKIKLMETGPCGPDLLPYLLNIATLVSRHRRPIWPAGRSQQVRRFC
jgi:hypothetical protein